MQLRRIHIHLKHVGIVRFEDAGLAEGCRDGRLVFQNLLDRRGFVSMETVLHRDVGLVFAALVGLLIFGNSRSGGLDGLGFGRWKVDLGGSEVVRFRYRLCFFRYSGDPSKAGGLNAGIV